MRLWLNPREDLRTSPFQAGAAIPPCPEHWANEGVIPHTEGMQYIDFLLCPTYGHQPKVTDLAWAFLSQILNIFSHRATMQTTAPESHLLWAPFLCSSMFHFLCMLHTCLVVCWAVQVFLGCLKPGLIFPTTLYTPVSRGSTGFLPQHVWAGFLQSPFTSSFGGSCCC